MAIRHAETVDKVHETFAMCMKRERERRGFTQKQLAERCNALRFDGSAMTQSRIAKYEAAAEMPSLRTFTVLCLALTVCPNNLLDINPATGRFEPYVEEDPT